MTADARKRLEAISEAQDLGAGFMLATHDLEIRGAGELLGEEQSGQIESIGKAATFGCVRLRNQDAVALFDLVKEGDIVRVVP